MDVQRSLSDIYNMCDLAHDTRSHLGAQEALQRAYRVCSARLCKKRHNGVHLGLDPVLAFTPPIHAHAPRALERTSRQQRARVAFMREERCVPEVALRL